MFNYCLFSVPESDPSGESVVLGYYDFLQLKDRARVLTAAEKAAREEQIKAEKEEKMVSQFGDFYLRIQQLISEMFVLSSLCPVRVIC